MSWCDYCVLFLGISLRLFSLESEAVLVADQKHLSDEHIDHKKQNGTKWAVLVAGSREYFNYRHQADVCHAYQILKKGGLKDENIIVFMYDDIAFNKYNPRPGIIINKPDGPDVYDGVPKDYSRKHVTAGNFYAAILGNRSALTGGSGKVLDSGPNDHIFIYYADHGAPGVLEMPSGDDHVFAKDFVDVLKKKHEAKGYKSMVIYIEACESGSIFAGLLPENINIYATTAANGKESSYGTYCPGDIYSSPPEYDTCLGDLYSISWMEEWYVRITNHISHLFGTSQGAGTAILTLLGGFHSQTQSLWLTDIAHHHLAIAFIFLIAGHMYRTNFRIGHSIKNLLEAHIPHASKFPCQAT